jgi:hypothetical protein
VVEKTTAKASGVSVPSSPTTMAWSSPLASLKVSVKALKTAGGFGKIMELMGLAITESDLLYVKADATPITAAGSNIIEINEDALANGKKQFTERLIAAGIDYDPAVVRFRIF